MSSYKIWMAQSKKSRMIKETAPEAKVAAFTVKKKKAIVYWKSGKR